MSHVEGNTIVAVSKEIAESMAKKLLHEVIVKAVIKKMVTELPILGTAFLNPIVSFIVSSIATRVYDAAVKYGGMFIIDLKGEGERKAYDEATLELRKVLTEGASPEEIERAKNEYKNRLARLIRLND